MPFRSFLRDPRMGRWLLGTVLCWLVFDFAYYGNSISAPEVLALLSPKTSLLDNTLLQLGIFVVFSLPRYVLAILFMDKAGRKSIRVLGSG
jgi:PHS family inorganic phosphate transporter-like MFS transporter